MVAMDLSKAFDSLPHSLLISKLRAYGLDNSSCAFLQTYLTGRFQRVKVGDEVSCWELNRRGVPQGSVLGPLCFNVFLNDLSYFILRVSLNAYADDQQLYGADSDHEALYARLDHDLRTFALIVSAHPYCARKSTCHAMPRHASSARAKC